MKPIHSLKWRFHKQLIMLMDLSIVSLNHARSWDTVWVATTKTLSVLSRSRFFQTSKQIAGLTAIKIIGAKVKVVIAIDSGFAYLFGFYRHHQLFFHQVFALDTSEDNCSTNWRVCFLKIFVWLAHVNVLKRVVSTTYFISG